MHIFAFLHIEERRVYRMGKVIVVGAGQWGKNLVRTFHELGALAGVAEADAKLRNSLRSDYPEIPVFEDYNLALDSPAEAFVIATPAPTHAGIAKEAMKAGKDVFIEKPMTLSSEDAEQLVQLAESGGRVLMTGHLLLYQPAVQMIKRMLEAGEIGTLKSLHQERLKLGRARAVENVLWSFGVHDLAVFLYLTGSQPEQVQASGQCIIQPSVEDDVHLHLHFPEGVDAHLHVSWLWPVQRRRLTVIGTSGMMVYDEDEQTVTLYRKTIDSGLSNVDEGTEVIFRGDSRPLTLECEHFLKCIRERLKPISDGMNGMNVIRILEQASQSLQGVQR